MAKNNNTLVFNGLMQGMSWDQIKEAKDEIKRHQGEKQPTRKDILTDWIIGKDYMLQQQGNSYQEGGFAGIDWKSGNFKYTGENGEPTIGNTNWLGAASSALQLVGDAFSDYNDIENKTDAFNTQLNQFQNQRFNIGDNAFLASEWDNRMILGDAPTREQFGYKNGWKVGLNALQNGLTTAGTTGNVFLGLGAAGLSAIKDLWLNSEAKEAQEEALTRYNIAQGQQPNLFNYSVDQAQRINAFNQLQNMAKNGGKLKKSHKFAEGGLLNNYFYGLEEVNAGGSHEENPNEGVIVSYAPDGLPNKVEEGETIHNDYVYSKRLEANEKVLKNNLLDEKYEGKSFADISKKLTEDRKQRPNDPISVRTNEENLNRLQGAQEELKLDNKTKEVKRFLGSLNNDQLNALQQEMMDEYEAYAEQLAQQQEQEDQAYQEEQAAQEGMFGRGGHLKQGKTNSRITATEPVYGPEGNIVGWRTPDTIPTENVLNLSGYNPNYEGAQIYADDRNWFQRNVVSPWNTWWDNLPSPEFSWAVRNLTPVGVADAAINGDTERILESALLKGLFGRGKNAAKAVDEADDALKIMQNAQLGENVTKEVTKEAAKKSFKWLKGLGTGVGITALPLASFWITDTENNKSKYDQKSTERGKNTGDTIIGDWQFKGDTIINNKTGEKIYSKGGHLLQIGGNKLDQQRYEKVKALYDQAYNNRYGNNRSYYNYPGFTEDYIQQLRAIDKFNSEDTFKLLYKDLYPYLNTKFTETIAPVSTTLNNQPTNIQSSYETLPSGSTSNTVEPPFYSYKYNSSEDPLLQNILTYDPLGINYLLNQNGIYPERPEVVAQRAKERGAKENSMKGQKGNNEDSTSSLSYLRYAPIFGSLGQVLSDTSGLTNQPNHSFTDMYRRAVDSIGGVNFVPIGGYQQFTPIDKEYIANQQLAQSAAYNRSLNNVNPVGSYIMELINDAKTRDQIGDMYIRAREADEQDKLKVAEYNRGIDITNARNSLSAQSENARLRAQRANEYQNIANMMNNERNIAEAARAANYDKFITNIGNLGKEEFAFNQVDSNAALLGYYTDRTGRARYRMPAFIKPDGFEAYKQYLKSHGVDESQIDA